MKKTKFSDAGVAARRPTCLWAALAVALISGTAFGQMRPVAIGGATILLGDGRQLDRGVVMFQGGKITAVAPKLDVPFMARKISGKGKYITPGLIDLHTTLGLTDATVRGQATARAVDAFDRYDADRLAAALARGITAVCVPARAANGVGGVGAVVRLLPQAALETCVLDDEAALCFAVHSGGPIARLKTTEALRSAFRAARDYRDAWDDYEEELEEYEEKLAERAKEQAKEDKQDGDEQKDKGDQPKSEEKPKKGKGKKGDKDKDKKDELKKPNEPATDRNAEMLLRVLDGELYLRIEAHTPADVLNALEVADEFHAAVMLEGATGAHFVAPTLAEHDVPVILSGPVGDLADRRGLGDLADVRAAAVLQQAGLDVYFGSGVVAPGQAPDLLLRAARAAAHGWDCDDVLRRLTHDAARLLRVDDEIGRIRPGLQADLVIWSDHPLAAGARVVRVFVGGQEVYQAE